MYSSFAYVGHADMKCSAASLIIITTIIINILNLFWPFSYQLTVFW